MPKFIVSIHDISPFYCRELEIIFNKLNRLKKELFIIPNLHNEHNISGNIQFLDILRGELDNPICLHGYSHMGLVSIWERLLFSKFDLGQNEFDSIDKSEAITRVNKGKKLVYDAFKIRPKKFVAPRWIFSKKHFGLLRECGFKYTESLFNLVDLDSNKSIKGLVTNFDFGRNQFMGYLLRQFSKSQVSFKMLTNNLIRLAIHPNDLRNKNFELELKLIKKLIEKGWEPITTEELDF